MKTCKSSEPLRYYSVAIGATDCGWYWSAHHVHMDQAKVQCVGELQRTELEQQAHEDAAAYIADLRASCALRQAEQLFY